MKKKMNDYQVSGWPSHSLSLPMKAKTKYIMKHANKIFMFHPLFS